MVGYFRVLWILFSISLTRIGASHFRGATIQWSPVYDSNGFTGSVQITHQISWTKSSNEGGACNQEAIESQNLIGENGGNLECRENCVGTIESMAYICTDFTSDWATGRRSYTYRISDGMEVFGAAFSGCCWQTLVLSGASARWDIRVRFNLTERHDTGQVNTSPTAVFFPATQLQHGCDHIIRIPVMDMDGDIIRCRWSLSENFECGGVCRDSRFPANLTSEECIIEFSAAAAVGAYTIALQIEDFISITDTQPLSSVPIQFIVDVLDLSISCETHIEFVGDTPANGACFGIASGQTHRGRITARDTLGHSITDIDTISPPGLIRGTVTRGNLSQDWYIDYEWTPNPTQLGFHLFCFLARNSQGSTSEQACITLSVRVFEVITSTQSPVGIINSSDSILWNVQFSDTFVRPSTSNFIRVLSENGQEVMSIDASTSNSVFYPNENGSVLTFITNFTAMEGLTYYVLFDLGVAVTNETCPISSLPIDNVTQWTVSIMVPDPCFGEPCDVNAVCTRLGLLSSNFTCSCRPGFTGDGFICAVPDPCLSDPCDINADCQRENILNNLFNCTCRAPFEGSGFNCSIPDPCLSNPCDPNAGCLRLSLLTANFSCSCNSGFTGNGHFCYVPDPCLSDPCDTNADCRRDNILNNLFNCTCRTPFEGSGFNCSIPDPCLRGPCDINATCLREGPLNDNFTCLCVEPFTGNGFNCSIPDPCLLSPCHANASCSREGIRSEEFHCECNVDFTGDGFNCTVPDPCLSDPCDTNAECKRDNVLNDLFNCTCRTPFEGSGFSCSIPDPCLHEPCDINATCVREGPLNDNFTCLCVEPFTGNGFNCSNTESEEFSAGMTVIIVSVSTAIAFVAVLLLIGAIYGYVKTFTKLVGTFQKSDSAMHSLITSSK